MFEYCICYSLEAKVNAQIASNSIFVYSKPLVFARPIVFKLESKPLFSVPLTADFLE